MFFTITFWLCAALLGYVYIAYPCILWIAAKFSSKPLPATTSDLEAQSITVLVPAHNEEKVIVNKIENLLALDYPTEKFDILVVSDGSTDNTNSIVHSYAHRYGKKVKLHVVENRLGKTNAINEVMQSMPASITVFTDANVLLDSSALRFINADFSDNAIGGVAGQLSYTNHDVNDAAASNGLYWQYEELIKEAESRTGSIMGADGSIFAIRTNLYQELPIHVLDDFCTSMGIVMKGHRFAFDARIKAFEKGAESSAEEFHRKIRISNRSYNSYRFLNPWQKLSRLNQWKFLSHKWLRWHSSTLMILALLTNILSLAVEPSILGKTTLYTQLFAYTLCIIKHYFPTFSPPLLGALYYFVLTNVACGIGILKSMCGTRIATWEKAISTR